MKLSKAQVDVLRKMAEGWTLEYVGGWKKRIYLTEPGGQYDSIVTPSANALIARGLIVAGEPIRNGHSYQYTPYTLTAASRAAAEGEEA